MDRLSPTCAGSGPSGSEDPTYHHPQPPGQCTSSCTSTRVQCGLRLSIGAAFLRLASTRSFHLSTIPETTTAESASTSTSTPRHRAVIRASKAVRLGRKNKYKTLDSLDTVVIDLQGYTFGELVESGLDGRKLVRTKEAGGWKLMLGPGSLMRVSQRFELSGTVYSKVASRASFTTIPAQSWPRDRRTVVPCSRMMA